MKRFIIFLLLTATLSAGIFENIGIGYKNSKNLTTIQYSDLGVPGVNISHSYFFMKEVSFNLGVGYEELNYFIFDTSPNPTHYYSNFGLTLGFIELFYKVSLNSNIPGFYYEKSIPGQMGANLVVPISWKNKVYFVPYIGYLDRPVLSYFGVDSNDHYTSDYDFDMGVRLGYSW